MNRTIASGGLALLIVAVVTADWLSKLWIINRLALGDSWALVDGWLFFVHRQNPGVAFSLFADLSGEWRILLFSLLRLTGIVVFSGIVRSTSDPLARFGGAAVIAGAIGNMGDRVVSGEVTDFVFVAFFPFVFNVADAAITLGGSVLAVRLAVAGDDGSSTPGVANAGGA